MSSCRRWPAIRAGPEVSAGVAGGRPAAAAVELSDATTPSHRTKQPARSGPTKSDDAAAVQAVATADVADLVPEMVEMWKTERLSLRAIADRLNADGQQTRRKKAWSSMQVKRVLDRASAV